MKKHLFTAAVLMLLLTGCSKFSESAEIVLPDEFSANVSIVLENSESTAEFSYTAEKTVLSYQTPDGVNGLVLTETSQLCKSEFNGLEVTGNSGFFSKNSAISLLDEVFGLLLRSDITLTREKCDKGNIFYLKDGDYTFEIITDFKTGEITQIRNPENSITFIFM